MLAGAEEIAGRHVPTDNPHLRISTLATEDLERRQLDCIKEIMAKATRYCVTAFERR